MARRYASHFLPPSGNLVPRVLWLFGQRIGASRDSGVLGFCYRKISAVKQWKSLQGSQSKNLNFFEFPRVSTGAHPLSKKPEDSGYEIGRRVHNLFLVLGCHTNHEIWGTHFPTSVHLCVIKSNLVSRVFRL